jgi:uncharacterized protein YjcR
MSPIPHEPTKETRRVVRELYACGIIHKRIAERLGINTDTLKKYYEQELDNHKEHLINKLAKTLYQKAEDGDQKALEFWLKCRGRWSYARESDGEEKTQALLEKIIDKL